MIIHSQVDKKTKNTQRIFIQQTNDVRRTKIPHRIEATARQDSQTLHTLIHSQVGENKKKNKTQTTFIKQTNDFR